MNNKVNKVVLAAQIEDFAKLARAITKSWSDLEFADSETSEKLAVQYPFDLSFDEMVEWIEDWNEAAQKILK